MQGALSEITAMATTQHAEVKKLLGEFKAALPSTGGRNDRGNDGGDGGGRNTHLPATEKEKL